jgi:hypothetical protein
MRRALAVAAVLGAAWAAVAAADGGGPSPGPTWGSPGVVDRVQSIRYVALNAGARNTMVEAVTTGGNVTRWAYLEGSYGVPAVAWDWSTGGLARKGHRLVLVSGPGPKWTRFVVLDPRSLRVRSHFRLRGAWAFDALSPDGSLLYLIQYHGSPWAINGSYAVRAYNLDTRRLYPGAIVDRREPDEKMTGRPSHASSPEAGRTRCTRARENGRSCMPSTPRTGAPSASTCRGGTRLAGSTACGCASTAASCSCGAAAW